MSTLVESAFRIVGVETLHLQPKAQKSGKPTEAWLLCQRALRLASDADKNRFLASLDPDMASAIYNVVRRVNVEYRVNNGGTYREFHLHMQRVLEAAGSSKADTFLRKLISKAYGNRFDSPIAEGKTSTGVKKAIGAVEPQETFDVDSHIVKLWRFIMNEQISAHQKLQTIGLIFNQLSETKVSITIASDGRFVSDKSKAGDKIDVSKLTQWTGKFEEYPAAAARWTMELSDDKEPVWTVVSTEVNSQFITPTLEGEQQLSDDTVRALFNTILTGSTYKYPGAQATWNEYTDDGKISRAIMEPSILSGIVQRTLAQASGPAECYWEDGEGNFAHRSKKGGKKKDSAPKKAWQFVGVDIPDDVMLAAKAEGVQMSSSTKKSDAAKEAMIKSWSALLGKQFMEDPAGTLTMSIMATVKALGEAEVEQVEVSSGTEGDGFEGAPESHPVAWMLSAGGKSYQTARTLFVD